MKKSLLLIPFLTLWSICTMANNSEDNTNSEKRSEICLDAGMAMPLGSFAEESTTEGIFGAKTGFFANIDYAYYIKENIAVTIGINTSSSAKSNEITVGTNTIYINGWSTTALLLGIKYTYSLNKFNLTPFLKIGSSINSSGNADITRYSSNSIKISEYPSSNSIAYQLGIKAVYPLNKRLKINVNSFYFGSKYSYEDYNQNITILNLGAGISYCF